MLKKLILLSICLCSSAVAMDAEMPILKENLPIGRYKLVPVVTSAGTSIFHDFYLVDTATGDVYKSAAKESWLIHDGWDLRIAGPGK